MGPTGRANVGTCRLDRGATRKDFHPLQAPSHSAHLLYLLLHIIMMDNQKFLNVFQEVLARNISPSPSVRVLLTTSADTNRVKAATATLRADYYSLPESLTILLQLLLSDQPSPLRQLAATQARSLVPKHWKKLPNGQKGRIREQLLQGTLQEEEKLVRHATARVITAVAKIDFENGEWLDVFDILLRAATDSNARQREVGTYLLFTSLESIGEALSSRFHELLAVFARTIRRFSAERSCTSVDVPC